MVIPFAVCFLRNVRRGTLEDANVLLGRTCSPYSSFISYGALICFVLQGLASDRVLMGRITLLAVVAACS